MAFLNPTFSWKTATGQDAAVLDSLQPNIIKAHIRERLTILFLKFDNQAGARSFVKAVATNLMKSARKHIKEVEDHKLLKKSGSPYIGLGLTWTGYEALGIPVSRRPADASFRGGMKKAKLNDPDPVEWEEEYRGQIDCVVLVGDETAGPKNIALKAVKALIKSSPGVSIIGKQQEGKGLHFDNKKKGEGIEHFGYVDGRSQPLFLAEDVEVETLKKDGATTWNPAFHRDRVAVPDPASADPSSHFGSYFVYRKLEQNVKQFKTDEIAFADALGLEDEDKERAGAMIVGRFEDGTPVTHQFAEGSHSPVPNDFNYDSDPSGGKCPHYAHIRKVNPRGSGGFNQTEQAERLHIMARRGQTYGTRKDNPNDGKLSNKPTKNVGLLFMAFNANIGEQFEFAQHRWANEPNFPEASPAPGLDMVIGQTPKGVSRPNVFSPKKWGNTNKEKTEALPQAVTMKGGEYFFMPSLAFLKNPV